MSLYRQFPMKKRTAALVLARGTLDSSWQPVNSGRYKALVPVNGVHMVEFVLKALQRSMVEKVFIVQGSDKALEKALTGHEKNVFVDCNSKVSSYSQSLYRGLGQLAEYYGREGLTGINIMMTPCDMPLVSSGNFNKLIEAQDGREFDFCIPMIKLIHLKEKYPGRDFLSLSYRDLGDAYCLQNLAFISGASLSVALYGVNHGKDGKTNLPQDNLLSDLARTIDHFAASRSNPYLISIICFEILRRLILKGHMLECLALLRRLSSGRYTTADARRFIYLASGLTADYICSEETELSFDIDAPEHLEAISGLMARLVSPIANKV